MSNTRSTRSSDKGAAETDAATGNDNLINLSDVRRQTRFHQPKAMN